MNVAFHLPCAQSDIPQLDMPSTEVQLLAGALIGYVMLLFGISLYASRQVKNEEDYLVAGRRLPLFLAWGTLIATWFGAATMFAAAEAAREDGLLGVVLDPFACAGTLVLSGIFFARPLWRMGLFTMADFYRKIYGPSAEVVGACIQVPSYFSWVALQYTALARLLELYFEIPLTAGIVVVAAVTLLYTLIGGMWAVTLTDTVQVLVALGGLVVLLISALSDPRLGNGDALQGLVRVYQQVGDTYPNHLRLLPVDMSYTVVLAWLGAWATGLFGNIPGQDLQQRAFAAKSANTAMYACIFAGCAYLLFGMIPVTLGLASLVTHPGQSIDPVGFLAGQYLSTGMLVVFVVAVVSMVVSTATSAVLAPATILGHNLFSRLNVFHASPLVRDRLCVVLVSIGGILLAMWGKSLMDLLDVALSIQLVALFVPVVMGIYGRPRGPLPAVLSMILGFSGWLIVFILENLPSLSSHVPLSYVTRIPSDFWGLGLAVFGYVLGQQLSKSKSFV